MTLPLLARSETRADVRPASGYLVIVPKVACDQRRRGDRWTTSRRNGGGSNGKRSTPLCRVPNGPLPEAIGRERLTACGQVTQWFIAPSQTASRRSYPDTEDGVTLPPSAVKQVCRTGTFRGDGSTDEVPLQ